VNTALGQPNGVAVAFFLLFIAVTLGITWWAARQTKTTSQFYAAGHSISGFQNGLALAGDYMSAASFLGIAGLVALSGFDGLIYSTGWLVGWPVVLFLIAEPLRNLGRYTFADVVAFRMRQRPVRIAAAVGTLATVMFYLIAQMVGAGNLIRLMFGLSYEAAVVAVGLVMLAYVLFGGMIATTWVQIVKAVLLLSGALLLTLLVLYRFSFNPGALFTAAAARYGSGVLAPGRLVANPWDAVSLGLALMFGTAGLPHILMRFYTVRDARAARTSVFYATGFIGFFYLLTFVLGFGAMVLVGQDAIRAVDKGGNMAAPLLAEVVGGTAFLGFIAGRGLRHHPGRGGRPHPLGGGRPLARPLGERGPARRGQRARAAPGGARGHACAGGDGHRPGRHLQGPERRVHGGAGLRHRRLRQLPGPLPVHVLARVQHRGRGGEHGRGDALGGRPHRRLADGPGGPPRAGDRPLSAPQTPA